MNEPEITKHPSGATSSKVFDYAQIPKHALDRLAARFQHGEKVHGRNNWRKGLGDKTYLIDRLNHVICHTYALIEKLENDLDLTSDDDASAIMWGGCFACEATRAQFEGKKQETRSTVDGKLIPILVCSKCGTTYENETELRNHLVRMEEIGDAFHR